MKTYTDLGQCLSLAKILQLKSADMKYPYLGNNEWGERPRLGEPLEYDNNIDKPCWSLAALLDILPYPQLSKDNLGADKIGWMVSVYPDNCRYDSFWHDNPIDACVDVVIKLHKKGLL